MANVVDRWTSAQAEAAFARDLSYAVALGDRTTMEAVLSRSMSPKKRRSLLDEALLEASRIGQPNAARLLILRGADPDSRDSNRATALSIAVYRKRYSVAQVLLQLGANSHLTDGHGNNALSYATEANDHVMIKLLMRYDTQPSRSSGVSLKQGAQWVVPR